jgi:hypothetical protein
VSRRTVADAQWARIEPPVPAKKGNRGRPGAGTVCWWTHPNGGSPPPAPFLPARPPILSYPKGQDWWPKRGGGPAQSRPIRPRTQAEQNIASPTGTARMPTQGSWRPLVTISVSARPVIGAPRRQDRRGRLDRKRTTTSCPVEMPPRMPPAWFEDRPARPAPSRSRRRWRCRSAPPPPCLRRSRPP